VYPVDEGPIREHLEHPVPDLSQSVWTVCIRRRLPKYWTLYHSVVYLFDLEDGKLVFVCTEGRHQYSQLTAVKFNRFNKTCRCFNS
jgi:hypothetical protein